MSRIKVNQDPEDEVVVEVMAKAIVDISEGIKRIRSGPLNEKALLILIQHATKTKNRNGSRYSVQEIKDILDGMENLSRTYLKSPLLRGRK
jgi:hypothetical protein